MSGKPCSACGHLSTLPPAGPPALSPRPHWPDVGELRKTVERYRAFNDQLERDQHGEDR